MKKTVFLFSLIALMSLSCDKHLDIKPQQAISTEVALSTEQGVKTALVGVYELLAAAPTFTGDVLLNSELLIDAENLYWTGFSNDLSQIFDKKITVNNFAVEFFWTNAYRIINQTNSILAALEAVKETERPAVAAEARFLRGMVYFNLINLFAKSWGDGDPTANPGVPIVTSPVEQNLKNPVIPRNTAAEVYALILEDLTFAKENLPPQNGVFPTAAAAGALLSRVYLMQEKYDLAAAEADQVIESGQYQLLPDPAQIFNPSENTPEDIFAIQVTSQDFFNRLSFFYTGVAEGGQGFIGITEEHLAKYDSTDKRGALFYEDQQNNIIRTEKWRVNSSRDGNVTQIRLAEMYLTRAEGRFRTGDISGATADINIIRKRAGLGEINASEIKLENILNERFLELAFEGHLYRDVKRNRKNVGMIPSTNPRFIYPIPQRELDVNAALVQNEGY